MLVILARVGTQSLRWALFSAPKFEYVVHDPHSKIWTQRNTISRIRIVDRPRTDLLLQKLLQCRRGLDPDPLDVAMLDELVSHCQVVMDERSGNVSQTVVIANYTFDPKIDDSERRVVVCNLPPEKSKKELLERRNSQPAQQREQVHEPICKPARDDGMRNIESSRFDVGEEYGERVRTCCRQSHNIVSPRARRLSELRLEEHGLCTYLGFGNSVDVELSWNWRVWSTRILFTHIYAYHLVVGSIA